MSLAQAFAGGIVRGPGSGCGAVGASSRCLSLSPRILEVARDLVQEIGVLLDVGEVRREVDRLRAYLPDRLAAGVVAGVGRMARKQDVAPQS